MLIYRTRDGALARNYYRRFVGNRQRDSRIEISLSELSEIAGEQFHIPFLGVLNSMLVAAGKVTRSMLHTTDRTACTNTKDVTTATASL